MTALYQLAVLGAPTEAQLNELTAFLTNAVAAFNLRLGHEVILEISPPIFKPPQLQSAAVVFFAGLDASQGNLDELLARGIPILPVISDPGQPHAGLPHALHAFHCLQYQAGDIQPIATALLESVGLLQKQRRVFISYLRTEAREAALQLIDTLTARHFDVFLDTNGTAPAPDFRPLLWHRLCDSDVLLMLDTPHYFNSRWTSAEFGRALAKGISVLRVGWPSFTPSIKATTASQLQLAAEEIDPVSGKLQTEALERICSKIEEARSQSHAVRSVNLISNIRIAALQSGAQLLGVGANKAMYIQMQDGRIVTAYPTVGVPASKTLQEIATYTPRHPAAVIYDVVGLHADHVAHLQWLDTFQSTRCISVSDASRQFAEWEH